jgi:hypothetical protein
MGYDKRIGFEVTSESDLPGLHTWFMRRGPQPPTQQGK